MKILKCLEEISNTLKYRKGKIYNSICYILDRQVNENRVEDPKLKDLGITALKKDLKIEYNNDRIKIIEIEKEFFISLNIEIINDYECSYILVLKNNNIKED